MDAGTRRHLTPAARLPRRPRVITQPPLNAMWKMSGQRNDDQLVDAAFANGQEIMGSSLLFVANQ